MFERVKLTQLNDHLWLMDDNGESTGYIVVGQEKALIIDTMNGYENVRGIAATVTDKPVTVVNTHGHGDHIFGNVWVDEALIGEDDLISALRASNSPGFVAACEQYGMHMPPFRTVKEGDVIDLGGLTLEVIAMPGHTKGSICLLLVEDRILFTGDAINHHLWMQLEESLSLEETLKNLDRIAYVKERADRILHGHAQGFDDISLFDEMREGIRQLAEQNGTEVTDSDEVYDWFGGKALQHKYRSCVIVYTRDKLRKVDMTPEFTVIDSFCGINCSECEFFLDKKCAGCVATKGVPFHSQDGKPCQLAACCMEKGIRYCADCADVPCEALKKFSYDPEYGDKPGGARIERLGEIKKDLLKKARQGQPRVAVCGFSCGESCFLGEWCGWCESDYNCCSFATLMPDGKCPHLQCVREKGLEGCWDCPELEGCTKGFYSNVQDMDAVNLAKSGCMFIRRFGKTTFSALLHCILTRSGKRYIDYFTDKSSTEKLLEAMTKELAQ